MLSKDKLKKKGTGTYEEGKEQSATEPIRPIRWSSVTKMPGEQLGKGWQISEVTKEEKKRRECI